MRISDWSSDVCSSDLCRLRKEQQLRRAYRYGYTVEGEALIRAPAVRIQLWKLITTAARPDPSAPRGGRRDRVWKPALPSPSARSAARPNCRRSAIAVAAMRSRPSGFRRRAGATGGIGGFISEERRGG